MNFKKIENKYQKKWEKQNLYVTRGPNSKFQTPTSKLYVLVEFPYPSGKGLHIGHAFTMTGADVYARKKRMEGKNVMFPMGWDAFGLPTENYAIKTNQKPQKVTKQNTDNFRRQMKKMAFSFDWEREINTADPDYYHWTQWIFIQLYKKGLAYKEEKPINWCPSCKIGLANEEVIDNKCERCGAEVTKKNLSQWIVRITDYADRLIDGLKQTDFVKKVEAAQINWIGKSEGARVKFSISPEEGSLWDNSQFSNKNLEVFTTRPDTLWGATFMVIAPEHKLTAELLKVKGNSEEVKRIAKIKDYIEQAKKKSEFERGELQKDKTGVFTGLYAINPVNNKKIPIWISDFVLSTYGTGAIMAVPAHDERDHAFAKKFDLPIIPVIKPKQDWDFNEKPYTNVNQGRMVNSDFINGLKPSEAITKIIDWLEKQGIGKKSVDYHLRDWIFSRQHYWGEPIPMIYCEKCARLPGRQGWTPVNEEDLPIKLPDVEKYEPTNTGESPLANLKDWVNTTCPKCGGPAKRETDTMPNWAGSDWYFLAYLFAGALSKSKVNGKNIFEENKSRLAYWLPVDVYIGGDEHNTLHLLYSRFIYQFLHDLGAVPKDIPEPYYHRISHGVILGQDHQRMSKSRGNTINPDEVWEKYGVDALRTYLMFIGPFTGTMAWNENALKGVSKFLDKFRKFIFSPANIQSQTPNTQVLINKLIKKVTEDIDSFSYNTAIAAMMKSLNKLTISNHQLTTSQKRVLVKLIAPFAPYLAEELWEHLRGKLGPTGASSKVESVHLQPWPKYNKKYLRSSEKEIVIQVNGKLRSRMTVSSEQSKDKERIIKLAKQDSKVAKYLENKEIKKTIFIPGRLINFVV